MKKMNLHGGRQLSAKEMKALKGGESLIGCSSATGLLIVYAPCLSDDDCPALPLFCCGEQVFGQCEFGSFCSYGNYICQ